MAGQATMASEKDITSTLKGMPNNPGRDPKRAVDGEKGSIGDKAFMDAIAFVVIAWAVVLFLAISLRHHNV